MRCHNKDLLLLTLINNKTKSQQVSLFITNVHLFTLFFSGRPSVAVQQRTSQSGLRGNGGIRRVSNQYSLYKYKLQTIRLRSRSIISHLLTWGEGGYNATSHQGAIISCRPSLLLESHLLSVSTSETNLKVKQALTVTGALGDSVDVLAGFKGEKRIIFA